MINRPIIGALFPGGNGFDTTEVHHAPILLYFLYISYFISSRRAFLGLKTEWNRTHVFFFFGCF